MVDGTPSSSVFTTCRFDDTGRVLAFDQHFNRLKEAAEQIRCPPPDRKIISTILSRSINDFGKKEGLARLDWSSEGQASCETRSLDQFKSPLVAITHPAPQWPRRFRGIKHGNWEPYLEARELAKENGADISLLVDNHAIVDADRATPLILDENGWAYSPGPEQGAVRSITLSLVSEHLESNGIPLRTAYLTEEMIRRCKELVVVGTGIGVLPVGEIDGVDIQLGTCLIELISEALKSAWKES
jgi:branched-subunit amino acid aminotransferase/4-amino-4-deoxychorismate lyase